MNDELKWKINPKYEARNLKIEKNVEREMETGEIKK